MTFTERLTKPVNHKGHEVAQAIAVIDDIADIGKGKGSILPLMNADQTD